MEIWVQLLGQIGLGCREVFFRKAELGDQKEYSKQEYRCLLYL
ncbi:hypothetical protein SAMN00777080_1282 [Aquiflexum balticum DSM 16537]|uniref:Uncharacterized protein n=1 Tax=Aquiflexum balticum DSM 16537 TaxID=758820 RepID=A0A1W2H198_9BACT|nr:hypothetical protein SAMN00777080_1282 [Aquiflexum balticum DSM 16537]